MRTKPVALGSWTAMALSVCVLQSIVASKAASGADNKPVSSYMPVVAMETFATVRKRMEGEKAAIEKRQQDLLREALRSEQQARQRRENVARQAGARRRAHKLGSGIMLRGLRAP